MKARWIERTWVAAISFVCALLLGRFAAAGAAPAPASPAGPAVSSGLLPRFIDFDIGAATVRGGASHQDNTNDIPPYVELPNAGYPITLLNFTVPPDYADDSDFDVRVLWTTTVGTCFFVLQAELVGYGPGHLAALFDPYWAGAGSPSDEAIVQVTTAYGTNELLIRFDAHGGFPTYPGDAMSLTLTRDATDLNDTCIDNILLRSVSVTYQGQTSYLPLIVR